MAYLLLPAEHGRWCVWVAGWICAAAEWSDLLDGRIARTRGEVSDFGKLADPFCDVIYRLSIFMALLLPAGGSGWPAAPVHLEWRAEHWHDFAEAAPSPGQLVFALHDGRLGIGLMPWLPVFLMVLRELIAGALRAMTATRGLVLAARTSGKVKAWFQGVVIISLAGDAGVLRHAALDPAPGILGARGCARRSAAPPSSTVHLGQPCDPRPPARAQARRLRMSRVGCCFAQPA